MSRVPAIALLGLALSAFMGPAAIPQVSGYAPPGSARVVDRASCNSGALASNPVEELRLALGAHRRFALAMEGKFRTNFFLPTTSAPAGAPGPDEVAARLRDLGDGRTAALIYAGDPVNRRRCIWLVDATGLLAHGSVPTTEFGEASRYQPARPPSFADMTGTSSASGRNLRRHLEGERPDVEAWRVDLMSASRQVLPPFLGDVARFDRLLVLPTGALSDFPFAALPVNGAPLGLTTAIVQLTDVNDLLNGRSFRFTPPNPTHPAVVVGDPTYAPHPLFGTPAQLEFALLEAEAVAGRMAPAALLVGTDATEAAFLARVTSTTYIHLATHGLADGVNPQDGSWLALAGGYLPARRIARLSLRANRPLVVMSACQTGLGKNFPTGVFGLARSWLYAGAGQVVMSQWDVNDTSTMRLMSAFTEALRTDPRPEYAMRSAFRTVSAAPEFEAPYYWAGFAVFGPPSK